MSLERAIPYDVRDVFAAVHAELLALLESLEPDDWQKPTACPAWQVRDLVAHLLDSDLRRLSLARDALELAPDEPIAGYDDLLRFLNRLNAEWVAAARRLSPRVLIDLHAQVGPQVAAYFDTLDLEAPAAFPVAWAGEEASTHRLDVAREYTEKWLHQQQIREATGRPLLDGRRFLHPVLDTFYQALPHAYRAVDAPPATAVAIIVDGEAGGTWIVRRGGSAGDGDRGGTGWRLWRGAGDEAAAATVRVPQDLAWRLLASRRRPDGWRDGLETDGPPALVEPCLGAVAVMA